MSTNTAQPMKTYSDTIEPIRHTAGPWLTSKDAVPIWHTQITVYAEDGGEQIATVFGTKANANLIAASPDLLAVAKGLREAVRQLMPLAAAGMPTSVDKECVFAGEWLDQANEVIQKAETNP